MLGCIGAFFHAVEDVCPHMCNKRLVTICFEELTDGLQVQLVGFLFVVVHVHDVFSVHPIFLEIAEIAHGGIERFAAILDELCEIERIFLHELDIVHVETLEHVLKIIEHVVEVLSDANQILSLERRDEIRRNIREYLVIDHVTAMFKLMSFRYVRKQVFGRGVLLDCLYQQISLFDSKVSELLERIE